MLKSVLYNVHQVMIVHTRSDYTVLFYEYDVLSEITFQIISSEF